MRHRCCMVIRRGPPPLPPIRRAPHHPPPPLERVRIHHVVLTSMHHRLLQRPDVLPVLQQMGRKVLPTT
jgi:hypothetical protein